MRNKKNTCLRHHITKLHKDERGLSLVEVIVAITILTVVAVAVLHSLVTSMLYNAKARNRQEMTLTAESIMEAFKGYDLDELKTRFEPLTGSGIEGVKVASTGGFSYRAFDDAGNDTTGSVSVGDTYEFSITDMEADNGQLYDVTITAKPNGTDKVMEPENIEPTRDAIFKGNDAYDSAARNKAVQHFWNNHTESELTSAFSSDADDKGYPKAYYAEDNDAEITADKIATMNIGSYIEIDGKDLTFTISENDGKYVVTAQLQYTYHLNKIPYYVKKQNKHDEYDEDPTLGGADRWSSKELAFFNATGSLAVPITMNGTEGSVYENPTEAELARLFVYYYPNYELSGADRIYINNNTGINLQCYIIKQRKAIGGLQTKESKYKGSVKIGSGSCEIFHNFKDNIGGGSTTAGCEITGAAGEYTLAELSGAPAGIVTKYEETEVLSYKITLEVKSKTNGNSVTTLESTMNEKIKKKSR